MTVLACDFGGTRIKLGLVRNGALLTQQTLPAHSDRTLAERLETVARALSDLCQTQGLKIAQCAGLGLSFPSTIDVQNARIIDYWGKFSDATDFDLRDWARNSLGVPVAIENDARMALIGEWRYGAGRECDNLVILTLGTGLGTAAVVEGKLLRGRHGQAGIYGGHLTVRYGGRPCSCGNIGCSEAEASTSVLQDLARNHPEFRSSGLTHEEVIDYAAVFRLAKQGDTLAQELRDHSLEVWSATVVNLIHAYDPEQAVLGGGIMASAESILPAIRRHVAKHAHTPWGKVEIKSSLLGDSAALFACEWLIQEHLRHP
jgi:glucokinase